MRDLVEFSKMYQSLIQQDIKSGKKFLTSSSDFLKNFVDVETALKTVKHTLKTEYNITN